MVDLTHEETQALTKPSQEVSYEDHRALKSAAQKLLSADETPQYLAAVARFALAIERSIRPHDSKARAWETTAITTAVHGKPCAEMFGHAADHIARDGSPDRAALLFEKAADNAISEELDSIAVLTYLRKARQTFDVSGNSPEAARLFIREKDAETRNTKWPQKAWLYVFKVISNYGESPRRVAFCAMLVIALCAIAYRLTGVISNVQGEIVYSVWTSVYFSLVTFTTLGYGDYSPPAGFGRLVASVEAVSGLLFMSLYLVTFVRKYGRK